MAQPVVQTPRVKAQHLASGWRPGRTREYTVKISPPPVRGICRVPTGDDQSGATHRRAASGWRTAFPALRAAWGITLLWCPGGLLRAAGQPASHTDRVVVRVLGGRHLIQAAVTAIRPEPAVQAAGGVADLLHAASGLLACSLPHWRRAAALDALGATVFAAASFRAAYRLADRPVPSAR